MYYLTVGAIFKNESHSLREWIEHYLFHGVEHIYLINDASTDNYKEILNPYIEKGQLTLYNANWDRHKLRQSCMYGHYILPHLKETQWLLMVDLDEFMWSPRAIDLRILLKHMEGLCQIQVEHTLFGSNGHKEQPSSIVTGFTRRSIDQPSQNPGLRKYFVNSNFPISYLNIHHATQTNKEDELHNFKCLGPEYFILNHYNCQSRDFWNNIKCTRGDADEYRVRTPEDFAAIDQNDIEDTRLLEQNRPILLDI